MSFSSFQKFYWRNLGREHAIKGRRPIFIEDKYGRIETNFPKGMGDFFVTDEAARIAGNHYLTGYDEGKRSKRTRRDSSKNYYRFR